MAAAAAVVTSPGALAESSQAISQKEQTTAQPEALRWTDHRIQNFTRAAWHWNDVLGTPHLRFGYRPGTTKSLAYAQWVLAQRVKAAHRLHVKAKKVLVKRTQLLAEHVKELRLELGLTAPARNLADDINVEIRFNRLRRLNSRLTTKWHDSALFGAFGCIHGYEGAWTANTGNGYYGGLQMDAAFQRLYGAQFLRRWGTADNWPVWAQMAAAATAYREGRGFYPWPNSARLCGLI